MPRSTSDHSLAFDQGNYIRAGFCLFEHTEVKVQMIKRNVKNSYHLATALLRTKLHIGPVALPFFAPLELQTATFTNFGRKAVFSLSYSRHDVTLTAAINRVAKPIKNLEIFHESETIPSSRVCASHHRFIPGINRKTNVGTI